MKAHSSPIRSGSSSNYATNHGDLKDAICLLEDRLYWISLRRMPLSFENPSSIFVMLDDQYVYEPFCHDFGPVNIGYTIKLCRHVDQLLKTTPKKIYLVTSYDGQKRANGAFMAVAYLVISQQKSPEEACRPFNTVYPPLIPFRDASQSLSTFNLTLLDCCKGLAKAISLNFLNYERFDADEYLKLEKVENGDINWVVPGKFIAFSSPSSRRITSDGFVHLTPDDYIVPFKQWKVTAIVRLNRPLYDRKRFVSAGMNHYDLYFPDGSTPSDDIVKKFLKICEEEGVVSVHCKAGLGRTGTMIALYMMKHYRFTATEAIAWLRICRPGMVIGIQQHYLQEKQSKMWNEGNLYPLKTVSLNVAFEKTRSERFLEHHSAKPHVPQKPKTAYTLPLEQIRKAQNDERALKSARSYPHETTESTPSTPKRFQLSQSAKATPPTPKEPVTPPSKRTDVESLLDSVKDSPIAPINIRYEKRSKDSSITKSSPLTRSSTVKPMTTKGMGRILQSQSLREKAQRSLTPPKNFFKTYSHLANSATNSLNLSGDSASALQIPLKKTHHIEAFNERNPRDNFLLVSSHY
ncbi:hypothetical protein C9374_004171 [Naegleria lovaniensis]|uniref:protein-tyrosine-phosphatase n=1 Tax=Naegleria lovaniensis TaxID=51637 RepID=A0AA88GN87_NAELO|nr:uncharacterized protein C9374_004171 [Naegleria lovaniensis]KAG2383500.1 hypothetical protein C9374_004171 [Naegleria lovaniensis]